MKIKILILLFFTLLSGVLTAQNVEPPRSTRELTKWERMFPTVKYGDNVYQKGSNWLTVGYGKGWHTNKNVPNINFSMAYHHRYKAMYFNAGWHFSGPEFFINKNEIRPMEQLNDVHVGAGLRFENRWYNFGFFIGPSFATTWVPVTVNHTKINHQLGAHIEVQTTFKFFYDLGIGTSFYGSFNKRYQVVGVQLHFYFSNAFKMKY